MNLPKNIYVVAEHPENKLISLHLKVHPEEDGEYTIGDAFIDTKSGNGEVNRQRVLSMDNFISTIKEHGFDEMEVGLIIERKLENMRDNDIL